MYFYYILSKVKLENLAKNSIRTLSSQGNNIGLRKVELTPIGCNSLKFQYIPDNNKVKRSCCTYKLKEEPKKQTHPFLKKNKKKDKNFIKFHGSKTSYDLINTCRISNLPKLSNPIHIEKKSKIEIKVEPDPEVLKEPELPKTIREAEFDIEIPKMTPLGPMLSNKQRLELWTRLLEKVINK